MVSVLAVLFGKYKVYVKVINFIAAINNTASMKPLKE